MGEWKTIYEDEVEERWVTLKVYESEDDGEEDDSPVVRVRQSHPLPMKRVNRSRGVTGQSPLQGKIQTTTPSPWILMPLRISKKS